MTTGHTAARRRQPPGPPTTPVGHRERFLEAVLGSAIDYAMFSTGRDGQVTVWSAGAVSMFGWTEAEMIGNPASIIFTPEDLAADIPRTEMITASTEGRCSVERWQRRKDGALLWARSETTPLADEQGQIYGYLKILRDRTPQRNAIEQQRADAELTRRVLGSSADRIEVLDLDAKLLFMTEAGQRLMQVADFSAMAGHSWPDLWPGDSNDSARRAIAAATAGSTGHFRAEAPTMEGAPRFWDVQITAILGADGRPERLLAVSRDITDSRIAEEALREAQSLNALILDNSTDCIVVLDLDGNTQYVSPGGQRSMEIVDVQAIIGLSWLRVWTGRGHERAQAAIAQAREGGVGRFQGFCPTHAGTPKWWDVLVSPLPGPDGRPERLVSVGRDITDLKKAEDEARRLAAIVEQSTDFIAAASTAGQVHFVNPAGLALLGLPDLPAAQALDMIQYVAPEDRAVITATAMPALHERGFWQGELHLLHAGTGARIPVLYTVFPLRDAQAVITGHGTVARDLTEARRTGARRVALLELGDRLREVATTADIAQAAAELAGHTLEASRAAYGAVDQHRATVDIEQGWSTPGLAGLSGTYAFHDFGSFFDALQHGETVIVDDVANDPRTAAETAAWLAIGTAAIINIPVFEHDRLVGLFVIQAAEPRHWTAEEVEFVQNVADRTRAAIARARAEQALRDLAASLERQVEERTADRNRIWQLSADIMLVARNDGTLLATNPAWSQVLGWSEQELVGTVVFDLVHPESQQGSRAANQAVTHGASVSRSESRYRHKDGTYRWIAWAAVPGDGLITGVGRDITAERAQAEALQQAEEALRQSQKMEAVGQLTGGIAHDFNNLLAGITGSLELMQARIAQGRTTGLDRYATAAHSAAQRAAALTHRLLAFSRQQTLDPKPTNVNRLIAGMEELIRRTIGPPIMLQVVGAAGLWTTLCDPNQLENALLNLCINARDAMPAGGRLTIETANANLDDDAARLRATPPGQYIALSVTDTGTGMTPDIVARVFDPFFTTKPLGQGTGLGLSMVYGFAKQSGGEAKIYSEPGQGTTVKLYLPRHHGDAGDTLDANATHLATAPRATAHETVLVVDDEPTIRMLVAELLNDLGYAAIEAPDGPTALRILETGAKIDLLITDVGLPGGMNGRQLADSARALRPGLHILFITGYAENAALGHGQVAPGMQVMTKPFAMDALALKVKAMLATP